VEWIVVGEEGEWGGYVRKRASRGRGGSGELGGIRVWCRVVQERVKLGCASEMRGG